MTLSSPSLHAESQVYSIQFHQGVSKYHGNHEHCAIFSVSLYHPLYNKVTLWSELSDIFLSFLCPSNVILLVKSFCIIVRVTYNYTHIGNTQNLQKYVTEELDGKVRRAIVEPVVLTSDQVHLMIPDIAEWDIVPNKRPSRVSWLT